MRFAILGWVRIGTATRPSTLSGTQIEAVTVELGGITQALQHATTEERAAIYPSLDIRLEYDDRSHHVRATSNLARMAPLTPEGRGELDAHGGVPGRSWHWRAD